MEAYRGDRSPSGKHDPKMSVDKKETAPLAAEELFTPERWLQDADYCKDF